MTYSLKRAYQILFCVLLLTISHLILEALPLSAQKAFPFGKDFITQYPHLDRNNFTPIAKRHHIFIEETYVDQKAFNHYVYDRKQELIKEILSINREELNHPTAEDYVFFTDCYIQRKKHFELNDPCARSDFNQDGIINHSDYDIFYYVYTTPMDNCKCDANFNPLQIIKDPSADANSNYILDACDFLLDLFSTSHTNPVIEVNNGKIILELGTSSPFLYNGEQIEFIYSFYGQGDGGKLGGAFCLNLIKYHSIGKAQAHSDLSDFSHAKAVIKTSIDIPQDTSHILLQSFVRRDAVTSRKSNVMTFELSMQ